MKRAFIPLAIFVALVVFLWIGLSLNPREVPSPLIGKPAPMFRLPQLHDATKTISPEDLLGKVWLLNVWASWCETCLQEHPLLVAMSERNIVPIYGLNYKDKRENGIAWLNNNGNPYALAAYDQAGNVGIDWGVYGVPESFLVDKAGIIRHKIIGAIKPSDMQQLLALIKELNGE